MCACLFNWLLVPSFLDCGKEAGALDYFSSQWLRAIGLARPMQRESRQGMESVVPFITHASHCSLEVVCVLGDEENKLVA